MITHPQRVVCALLVLGVPCFVNGCNNSDSGRASSTEEQQAQQQQVISKVQSDSKMPPDVKQSVTQQIQSEAARQQQRPVTQP